MRVFENSKANWLGGVILLAVLVAYCSPRNSDPVVKFAQLTDPHIFDAGKLRVGVPQSSLQQEEIKTTNDAFDWALEDLKHRSDLDFLVITGDFGLEDPRQSVDDQARIAAEKLNSVPVKDVLIVPGNNDITDEDPRDIGRYRNFVGKVQKRIGIGKQITDLTQSEYKIKDVTFLGLDSSSFKNKDCHSSPSNQKIIARCNAAYKYQTDELNRVQTALGKVTKNKPAIIFTHVPDLLDPFNNSVESWALEPATRQMWVTMVANTTTLKAVFAGHFHSDNKNFYGDHATLPPGSSGSTPRFIVCPPLASKFQLGKERAQGYLIGRINSQNGDIRYHITFLRSG